MSVRRVNRCLNVKLQAICQQAVQLEELNAKLALFLPETLRTQCHVGSFNKGCLVLITHDQVWASQLRYSVPELRDKLRCEAGIYQLSSIKVTVAIESAAKPAKKTSIKPISTKARDNILAQASECSYLPLKDALLSLAAHHDES